MNGQEKVFTANRGRSLLKNVIELFHGMEYPQIALSRKRSFDNMCSGAPGYSRTWPFSNLPERGQLREHAIIRVGRPRIEIKTGVDIVIHAGQAYQGRVAGVGRRLHLLNKVQALANVDYGARLGYLAARKGNSWAHGLRFRTVQDNPFTEPALGRTA